ncbi:MAG TPA: AsmA family protein [Alphaproteobacteria bacterium]|nr:AsmA family protein [Alphaproteobacteria bacterium]
MRRVKQIITVLVCLVVLFFVTLSIVVYSVDINKYRPQIVEALSKQTGRTVQLKGPLKLGMSLSGVKLSISDASIGNPSWASRPEMAGIGQFELGVALMPLLSKQLSITELKIVNADILLETSGDKHNWDMPATQQPGQTTAKSGASPSGPPVSLRVDNVSVKNSQIAIRGADGKTNTFKTEDLSFGVQGGGIGLKFTGDYNNSPVTANVHTGASDFNSSGTWPIDADLTYADYHLKLKGKADLGKKTANFDSYDVSAKKSDIHGQMSASWGGKVPSVKGTLISDSLNPADFQPAADKNGPTVAEQKEAKSSGPKRMFSDEPLALDGLKSADANLQVQLAEVMAGTTELKNVTGDLQLNGGRLSLPVKAMLGKNPVNVDIKLDASGSTAQFALSFTAPKSDLADLLKLGGGKAFLSGTADTDMTVTSSGNSLHALASNANGKLNVIADDGQVSSSEASGISSSLAKIFAPNGTNALNCLAARFNIVNGVVKDNGLLVDTTATTIFGKGGANLGTETVDMNLNAKTKLVNIGGILPPLHIGGTLSDPSYGMDPTAVAKNVVGILTSGSLTGNSGVPDMQKAAGQNACVYTLDHPVAAQPSAAQNVSTKANDAVKNAGSLVKGLFGK